MTIPRTETQYAIAKGELSRMCYDAQKITDPIKKQRLINMINERQVSLIELRNRMKAEQEEMRSDGNDTSS